MSDDPETLQRPIRTVDYHTAGEPFRIVTGGIPELEGRTVLERRRWAADHLDDVRRLIVNEPRGHADMYGGFVTPPNDDWADLGVVFFHNEGYSTACGHGTIALVTWAVETGRIAVAPEARSVAVTVDLGGLTAADVCVQGVHGPVAHDGEFTSTEVVELTPGADGVYRGDVAIAAAGTHGISARVFPVHPDLANRLDMGRIAWAE